MEFLVGLPRPAQPNHLLCLFLDMCPSVNSSHFFVSEGLYALGIYNKCEKLKASRKTLSAVFLTEPPFFVEVLGFLGNKRNNMTRCYEYYCMVKKDAKKCFKAARMRAYIFSYIMAMESRGITFDNTSEDKQKFEETRGEIGSERAFLQQVASHDEKSVVLSKEAILNLEKELNVLHGDFREKSKVIPDNSVNLILTDPPYGEIYLELWNSLSELGNRVLVPGGYLIAYSGTMYLPKVFARMSNLEYFWTFSLQLQNRDLVTWLNIQQWWKPLLVFYKPPLKLQPIYIKDVIEGSGREKDSHHWQQSEKEIYSLIEYFCPKNGVILDPMAGSGTTLVASEKLGRNYIGIEIDANNLPKIKERLQCNLN